MMHNILACATVTLLLVLTLFSSQFAPATFAQSPEKPEKSGQGVCPDNFQLVSAREHPRADGNHNGWICMGRIDKGGQKQVVFVDDRMRDPKAEKRGCPDDFRLVAAREYPQADRNGNGWVCRKMSGDKQFTDDKS